MKLRLIKRRHGHIRRIDHLSFALEGKPDQPMVNIDGLMVFAVHVQQNTRPEFPFLKLLKERFDPKRFDQEKSPSSFGAMPLNPMNKEVIGIQLVRHDEVVSPHPTRHPDAEAAVLSIPAAAWNNEPDHAWS